MKGAKINFGVPNSEYVLLADDNGVAVSLKNQDTDTEYIGGGGGSSDYPTITATWNEDTQSYTYACDMTYAEISALISQYDSSVYPGIYNDVGYGMEGGDWLPGEEALSFDTPNGLHFSYDSDNVLTFLNE